MHVETIFAADKRIFIIIKYRFIKTESCLLFKLISLINKVNEKFLLLTM